MVRFLANRYKFNDKWILRQVCICMETSILDIVSKYVWPLFIDCKNPGQQFSQSQRFILMCGSDCLGTTPL